MNTDQLPQVDSEKTELKEMLDLADAVKVVQEPPQSDSEKLKLKLMSDSFDAVNVVQELLQSDSEKAELKSISDSVDAVNDVQAFPQSDSENPKPKAMSDSLDAANVVQELLQSDSEKPELKSISDPVDAVDVVQELPQSDSENPKPNSMSDSLDAANVVQELLQSDSEKPELESISDSFDAVNVVQELPQSDSENTKPKAMSDSLDAVNVVQDLLQSDLEKPELKSISDSVVQELPQSYSEVTAVLYGPDVNAPFEAEDDAVNVNPQRSFSYSPNIAEDDGVLCGPSSEHFIDEMETDKKDLTTVVFYPDHMVYRDSYCTDCVLTFTSSCITIEGSTYDDDKNLNFKWGIQDISHIKSHWYGWVGMAMVTIHILDNDTVHTENVECTSGTELKFSITGANWYGKQEAVSSLNVAYRSLWSNMFESEELGNGHTLTFFTKYFPNFDQPFEEVIYPKGDVDAVSLSKREVDMLLPDTFVNDTIIDFYIKYLKNRIKPEDKNRFHFFNSFFFRKLADPEKRPLDASEGKAGFQRVRKWTRKVNIFEKDYVFIPINYNYHWSLIVMCHLGEVATYDEEDVTKLNKVPCVLHMDSIRGSHSGLKPLMQSYLKEEWKGRIQDESDDISSRFDNLRFISLELPQQPNSFDCGLFLLHYVELFLEQAPLYFNPFHITNSVNFLNVDWFTPADASLKRVVIQRLVYDLIEQPSHKVQPSIIANDDNHIDKETAVNFFPVTCNNSSTLCQNSQEHSIEMSLLPSLSMTSESCPVGPIASSKSEFEPGSFLGMQFSSFNETMFDSYKCSLEPLVEEDVETSGQFIYSATEIDLQQDDEIEIIPQHTYSSQDFKSSRQSWDQNNNLETSPETSISGCEDSLELINTGNQMNEEFAFKEIEDQQPRINEEFDFKELEDQQPRSPFMEPIELLDSNNLASEMQANGHVGSDESSGFESDVQNPTKRMRMTEPTLEGGPTSNKV